MCHILIYFTCSSLLDPFFCFCFRSSSYFFRPSRYSATASLDGFFSTGETSHNSSSFHIIYVYAYCLLSIPTLQNKRLLDRCHFFFLINRPQTELKNHRPKSFFCLVLFLLGCCCHSVKQESHPSLKHSIPTHPHFLTCLTPKNDKIAKQDGDNVKKQKKKSASASK